MDNTAETLLASLREALETADPARIAVDAARDVAFSSGLHAGELAFLREGLGPTWADRFVVEPMLAVEVVGTMVGGRLAWYRRLQETAWAVIAEGFSARAIRPGATTTVDLEWWFRERLVALNYSTWFQPSVTVLDERFPISGAAADGVEKVDGGGRVIRHGDLLHVDFGVTALGLNTDTQHLAYVLHPGETEEDVPPGLVEGLRKGNRMQDIVREKMVVGRSGNEILEECLKLMREEGIQGKVYSHPVGDWGHSAGTLIGEFLFCDRV